MSKISTAVLGGTGIVGQRFIKILENHPFFDLSSIIASQKNEGKKYGNATHWQIEEEIPSYAKKIEIKTFNLEWFKKNDIRVVFSALPPDVASTQEKILAENGIAVFSNSRAYRYENDVPVLIPEVNSDHINLINPHIDKDKGFVITNANCSTTGLAIALKPLIKFNIQNVIVTTYQALSGAGYPGVPSLDITGNVVPFIAGEEEKIVLETQKILGKFQYDHIKNNEIPIMSSCARVPVRDGHLESVVVEFDQVVDVLKIKQAFNRFPSIKDLPTSPEKPIILREEDDRPQPLKDAYAGKPYKTRGMSITVGTLNNSNRWILIFQSYFIIQSSKIELHFPGIFRFEISDF